MSTYDGDKRAWNWEKYIARNVKYHIILGNLMKYGFQGLDPGSKGQYLLSGIRSDKFSKAVTIVRVHPDKYKKDFNAVVTFLTIDKKVPTPSVELASVTQTRPAKQQKTFTVMALSKGR